DRITFTGVYTVVVLLGTASGYGTLLYGQVSSKLGDARPQTVSVGLSDEARKALPAPFATSASKALEGKLIHQTSTHTYVESSGRTVRFRTADVVALVIAPEPEHDFWKEYLQRSTTVQPPLNPSLKGTSADKPASGS
ncbi:MAG: hypothetical protein Q8N74_05415, partial [Sulfuricella sp.]|nr:hypothetical protein [Sulfuricella sp.]